MKSFNESDIYESFGESYHNNVPYFLVQLLSGFEAFVVEFQASASAIFRPRFNKLIYNYTRLLNYPMSSGIHRPKPYKLGLNDHLTLSH